jgi:hypothetical protein
MHHHQFNIQQLYALPTLYLCVLYLSENKHWNNSYYINPLNANLNPICHLLVLLAHPIVYISRIRVNESHYICTFY